MGLQALKLKLLQPWRDSRRVLMFFVKSGGNTHFRRDRWRISLFEHRKAKGFTLADAP
jgi:hypothetical protein